MDQACEAIDRDPATMTWSNALVLCVGEDEAEVERRAEATGQSTSDLRANGLAGTPQEVLDKMARFGDLGSQRLYLQVLDLQDLDHLRLVAREVMPHLPTTSAG